MGLFIATIIVATWLGHLTWCLWFDVSMPLLHIALQAFFTTGLFITAHDAMHGTVHRQAIVNTIVGRACAWMFACMSYNRLRTNHYKHHAHPAHDELDPDFHSSSKLVPWFASFMYRYTTIPQLLWNGALFNVLAHGMGVPQMRLILFWIVPSLLASFQLFYVGTYLPHRRPHLPAMPHNARSQGKNHLWAFVSCYFFGYHREHHEYPGAPWWSLWKVKNAAAGQ